MAYHIRAMADGTWVEFKVVIFNDILKTDTNHDGI